MYQMTSSYLQTFSFSLSRSRLRETHFASLPIMQMCNDVPQLVDIKCHHKSTYTTHHARLQPAFSLHPCPIKVRKQPLSGQTQFTCERIDIHSQDTRGSPLSIHEPVAFRQNLGFLRLSCKLLGHVHPVYCLTLHARDFLALILNTHPLHFVYGPECLKRVYEPRNIFVVAAD